MVTLVRFGQLGYTKYYIIWPNGGFGSVAEGRVGIRYGGGQVPTKGFPMSLIKWYEIS